jgi:hypothetical protein
VREQLNQLRKQQKQLKEQQKKELHEQEQRRLLVQSRISTKLSTLEEKLGIQSKTLRLGGKPSSTYKRRTCKCKNNKNKRQRKTHRQ